MSLQGIFKRWIVTAYNDDGQAYRYVAETETDANNQRGIFADMNLNRVNVRPVLWDTRKGCIV